MKIITKLVGALFFVVVCGSSAFMDSLKPQPEQMAGSWYTLATETPLAFVGVIVILGVILFVLYVIFTAIDSIRHHGIAEELGNEPLRVPDPDRRMLTHREVAQLARDERATKETIEAKEQYLARLRRK